MKLKKKTKNRNGGVGRDVAVVALDNMFAACYEGKQIALHHISYQRKDMVVNPQHYCSLTVKQSVNVENPLLEQEIFYRK